MLDKIKLNEPKNLIGQKGGIRFKPNCLARSTLFYLTSLLLDHKISNHDLLVHINIRQELVRSKSKALRHNQNFLKFGD